MHRRRRRREAYRAFPVPLSHAVRLQRPSLPLYQTQWPWRDRCPTRRRSQGQPSLENESYHRSLQCVPRVLYCREKTQEAHRSPPISIRFTERDDSWRRQLAVRPEEERVSVKEEVFHVAKNSEEIRARDVAA